MRPRLSLPSSFVFPLLARTTAGLALAVGGLALAVPSLPGHDFDRLDRAARQHGPRAEAALKALVPLLDAASELDDPGKLLAVNAFFNRRIAFRDDLEVWGEVDHWSTPLETLAMGEGDCEDFAIAKFFSLAALGVPGAQLRLVYVRARLPGPPAREQAHMVLAHYRTPGADPSILDNLVAEVQPAARRPDLTPVYSFNRDGLWLGLGTQAAGDPMRRLSRWRDLVQRARDEGFP